MSIFIPNEINEIETKPQNRVESAFLTCREQNFHLLPDTHIFRREDFLTYRLEDMRDSEVEAMVRSRQEDFAKRKKSPVVFLRAISANTSILQLHRNPLLLTLSIGFYIERIDDVVPHDLATFYEESIDHLLRRRGQASSYNATDKYHLLQKFALSRLDEATRRHEDFEDFRIRDLIREAENLAQDRLRIEAEEAGALVAEIHEQAGLINDLGGREQFAFAHRSLHEFCAARQLANLAEQGRDHVIDRLDHPGWRQTIIFYCSIDHPHADRIIERLLERAGSRAVQRYGVEALTLAAACTAVLAQPRVPLRLQVTHTLIETIRCLTDDEEHRLMLLITLLTLGRDAPAEVRNRIDSVLQTLIDLEDPQQFARELHRLDQETAISLLDFMVRAKRQDYQEAALIGLTDIEGIEKVDLLWQLLEYFYTQNALHLAAATRQQLMEVMQLEGGMTRLDIQPNLMAEIIDDEAARQAYPFGEETAPPSNFARLLALEAQGTKDHPPITNWLVPGQAWTSFYHAAVMPRSSHPRQAENLLRQWRRLPQDIQRRVWRMRWQTLGRVWFGIGFLAGGFASWGFLRNYTTGISWINIGAAILSMAFSTTLLWYFALSTRF